MQLTFVHVDGSKKGQTEVFNQPIVAVGRDPSNQLAFDPHKDVDVSSRHAQFLWQGEQLLIQDLGSRNGTFVNGQRAGNTPIPVPPTAIVQFGDKGPKVQVTFKSAPQAPGKKTQMIQDLQQQMTNQQKQASASKGKLVFFFLFVMIVGGVGVGGFMWWSKRVAAQETLAKAQDTVAKWEKKVENAKSEANAVEVGKYAPDELKKANAVEKEGVDAKAASKLDLAASKLEDAVEAYNHAQRIASQKQQQTQIHTEETKATEARTVVIKQAEEKKKVEDEGRVKELERKLKEVTEKGKLKPLVDAALVSNKVDEIQKTLDQANEMAKTVKDDELKGWIKSLSSRVEDLKLMPVKLEKVALESKPVMVAVQTLAYAIPKGQTESTTEIRELVGIASATGFLVSKDKVVTTKEAVEPWRFDDRTCALAAYWAKFGYQIRTKTDVLAIPKDGLWKVIKKDIKDLVGAASGDTAPVFTQIATTDPTLAKPTATILYKGADALVDKPVDYPLDFKGATNTFSVQRHKRESGNLAVIQLATPADMAVTLAPAEAKPGDHVVILVQQKVGDTQNVGLYSQTSEITTHAGLTDSFLGVGGYQSWSGGAVLNSDGQVVGLIDEVQGEWMRMMSPALIQNALGK